MKNNYIDVNNIEIARVEENNEIQVYDDIGKLLFSLPKMSTWGKEQIDEVIRIANYFYYLGGRDSQPTEIYELHIRNKGYSWTSKGLYLSKEKIQSDISSKIFGEYDYPIKIEEIKLK